MKKQVLLLTVALIAVGRLFITPRLNLPTWENEYESFSHLFVGGMFGYWWCTAWNTYDTPKGTVSVWMPQWSDKLTWWLAWALSFFELIMFLLQKFKVIG